MEDINVLWQRLVALSNGSSHSEEFAQTVQECLSQREKFLSLLRHVLVNPNPGYWLAGHLVKYLDQTEIIAVYPELIMRFVRIRLQSIKEIEDAILSLPQDWMLEHIEGYSALALQDADDWAYTVLLPLYKKIDYGLMLRLADKAAQSPDPEIREVGQSALQTT